MNLKCLFIGLYIGISLLATSQTPLTLEESILSARQFVPTNLEQVGWRGNTETYYYIKENSLMTGRVKGRGVDAKLFSLEELNTWKGGDAMKAIPMLNWTGEETFWFEDAAKFYSVNLKTKSAKQIAMYPQDAENMDYHAGSNHIAFTKDNNLLAIVDGNTLEITKNAKGVISGQSISRNEYGISKGTFWNTAGNKLAFYEKDETNVSNYPLTNYKEIPATVREIKYPFAGGSSEIVRVGVYDVASAKTVYLQLNNGKENDQYYATNLGWSADGSLIYLAMLNRGTTDMNLISFDATSGKQVAVLFNEHNDKWVEPEQAIQLIPNVNAKFLWFSQRSGNNNLYLYTTDGKLLGQTKLKFELNEIVGFDAKSENVYVLGTGEIPTETMTFKINFKDMSVTPIAQPHGTHTIKMNYSGAYAIDQYSNLSTPNVVNVINTKTGVLKNLHTAPNPFANKQAAQIELFSIKANDGSDLWCRIIKPKNFDPQKKYPVLVYVYGGPHAQMNVNRWNGGASLWMNAMAEKGYVIFTLDNHGSGHRGQAWEQVIHRQLGTREVEDQMLGVEWLKKQSFVDANKLAVHGWSFGGFMTTTLMLKKPDTFIVGVAGGPVIDWALYEVMYGERYMDTPAENPDGYKNADLTQHVKNLKGKLLMIHGTDDDVVVMQHNMKFVKACVDNKVQVDFFAYPGHAHNVQGKDRYHLMVKVLDYVMGELER
jgi:dipeptidyl-peptidase-4